MNHEISVDMKFIHFGKQICKHPLWKFIFIIPVKRIRCNLKSLLLRRTNQNECDFYQQNCRLWVSFCCWIRLKDAATKNEKIANKYEWLKKHGSWSLGDGMTSYGKENSWPSIVVIIVFAIWIISFHFILERYKSLRWLNERAQIVWLNWFNCVQPAGNKFRLEITFFKSSMD